MNKVIYTVVTGTEYPLAEPIVENKEWEHICFTNNPKLVSKNWDIRLLKHNHGLDNQKLSRVVKILHYLFINKSIDITIYIDSKFTIKRNLDKFVDMYAPRTTDIAIMKHNRRKCAYAEATFLIEQQMANRKLLLNQINAYKAAQFPRNFGLFAPGIMIRRNNSPLINILMDNWWKEVEKWTYRDMIGLAYAIWKTPNLNIGIMPFYEVYNSFMNRK